ncbi:rhomboid family domain-containing protein [Ditylenchus destructor]|uniref:rhomboid protease n=1 Tax=Ditylenchus destructor TaxID=166010 RepID=A0AAD4R5G3_9BILA|nr:rhomboid family domain-containing protein [Ditylenchus destructor]
MSTQESHPQFAAYKVYLRRILATGKIPLRPASDLWKAAGFTATVCYLKYNTAQYFNKRLKWVRGDSSPGRFITWDDSSPIEKTPYFGISRRRTKSKVAYKGSLVMFTVGAYVDYRMEKRRPISSGINLSSPPSGISLYEVFGEKSRVLPPEFARYRRGILIICGTVFLILNIALMTHLQKQQIMPYFTSSFASQRLYWPMLLAIFTHIRTWHLVQNMFSLYVYVYKGSIFLEIGQLNALYISGGLMALLAQLVYSYVSGSPKPACGASGALSAISGFFGTKTSGSLYLLSIQLLDMLCTPKLFQLLKFQVKIGHAAHLGGAAFGWFYAKWGEKYYRNTFRPFMYRIFMKIENKSTLLLWI